MARSTACILLLTASAALAGGCGASAQPLLGAQTPSHNIFCLASPAQDGQPSEVRCDIQQTSTRQPPAPRNCPLSWGDAFAVGPTGVGRLVCHGDTVKNADDPVIAYGTQWRSYGVTCTSRTTGLTCVNGQGHGFSLARAAQRVF